MITTWNKPGLITVSLVTLLTVAVFTGSCSSGFFSSPSENSSTSAKPSSRASQLPASSLEIKSFQAQPKRVKLGETTTLSWDMAGATSFTISPDIGIITGNTGSAVISPKGTTLYTLKATDGPYNTESRFLVIVETEDGKIAWPGIATDNTSRPAPGETWVYYPNKDVNWEISDNFQYPNVELGSLCNQIGHITNKSAAWAMTDVWVNGENIATVIAPGDKLSYSKGLDCKQRALKWKWKGLR
jgi:hypothetical protein